MFISYLFSFLSMATPAPLATSNLCTLKKTYIHRGLHCCLSENFDRRQCEEKVKQLPNDFIHQLQKETVKIKANKYPRGATSNCFWTSLSFFKSAVRKSPQTWYEGEFKKELLKTHVAASTPLVGDIIVFNGQHTSYPDVLMGEPVHTEVPFHSAIYLGDGIVLQKENSTNEIFSLSELKASFAGYKQGFTEINPEGELKQQVFRKK